MRDDGRDYDFDERHAPRRCGRCGLCFGILEEGLALECGICRTELCDDCVSEQELAAECCWWCWAA